MSIDLVQGNRLVPAVLSDHRAAQRGRVANHLVVRWAFGGVTGTVAEVPALVEQLDPDAWYGLYQHRPRKGGVVLLYWVEFDEPADDGSGDAPYNGATIEHENLEPDDS